jgi:hypothetical protein
LIEWSGRFRVYFNVHGPLPWSIDQGGEATEHAVAILVVDAPCVSHYAGPNVPSDRPSGYLEGVGRVRINGEIGWVLRLASAPTPPESATR